MFFLHNMFFSRNICISILIILIIKNIVLAICKKPLNFPYKYTNFTHYFLWSVVIVSKKTYFCYSNIFQMKVLIRALIFWIWSWIIKSRLIQNYLQALVWFILHHQWRSNRWKSDFSENISFCSESFLSPLIFLSELGYRVFLQSLTNMAFSTVPSKTKIYISNKI